MANYSGKYRRDFDKIIAPPHARASAKLARVKRLKDFNDYCKTHLRNKSPMQIANDRLAKIVCQRFAEYYHKDRVPESIVKQAETVYKADEDGLWDNNTCAAYAHALLCDIKRDNKIVIPDK
jgi:hypothetical protein